jgi:hypothetical protein
MLPDIKESDLGTQLNLNEPSSSPNELLASQEGPCCAVLCDFISRYECGRLSPALKQEHK